MNWFKDMGRQLADTAKAKAAEAKQRLEEPELSPEEKDAFQQFNRVRAHIPANLLAILPPAPASETMWNRAEIRTLVADPEFGPALELGGDLLAIHEQEEALRAAEEDNERQKAREEEARQKAL